MRDALTVLPVGVENSGGDRIARLNWNMLQVRYTPFWRRATLVNPSLPMQDEQLTVYATATIALGHIVYKIDQIHAIVRSLVGERRFDALDDLARERAERDIEWLGKA